MRTRTLRRKAAALLALLPLMLLTSIASAMSIKGKRSRLRTLTQGSESTILDHIFEPDGETAHVVPKRDSSSTSSGGKACTSMAKAKKAPLLLPLAHPTLEPKVKDAKVEVKEEAQAEIKDEAKAEIKEEGVKIKEASALCSDDEETADDTEENSVNGNCTSLLDDGPLPEQLTSDSFHLGMNLGIDPATAGISEILQNFLNSIVLDDLAVCSSSGDHRISQDGNILALDFDVDDDTIQCLDGVPQRMGITTEYCSEFNVSVTAIHDGMPTNILVLSIMQGIQDRCHLIPELDGVMVVDTLCAFYVDSSDMEGDDFTTGDEDYSGDIVGGGDFTDPIDNEDSDGGGNNTTGAGSDSSSGSEGVVDGSDNNGGSDGSDTSGSGTDGETDSATEGGSDSTSGADGDGDDTSGGGGDISVDPDRPNDGDGDGDVDGSDGGVLIDSDGDSNESGDEDREIVAAGLESQSEDDDSMGAGGYLAIAAAALLLLFLLFAVTRRRRTHEYMGHKQLDDDFEDDTYLKDEASIGDSPRNLSHIVDESDGSIMSGLVISKLGSPYGRAPRSYTRDVHVCSSATCDLCEQRRQSGLQFIPTGMPSHSSSLPRETTRRYVTEDTVNL